MINDLIQKYVMESSQTKLKMQSKLFELFTETTGYRPEDICLVERQIKKGDTEYETIFYFDIKAKHVYAGPSTSRKPIQWPTEEEVFQAGREYALGEHDTCHMVDFKAGVKWLKSFVEKDSQ